MKFSKEQLDQVKSKIRELLKDGEVVELLSEKIADTVLNTISAEMGELKAKVTALEEENAVLRKSNEDVKKCLQSVSEQCDDQEQYSRRSCLRLFGLPEVDNENTDELVVNLCRDQLKINVGIEDIDRSHRVGKNRQSVSDHAVTRSKN